MQAKKPVRNPLTPRRWARIVEGELKRRNAVDYGKTIGRGEYEDFHHPQVRKALTERINRQIFRGTKLSPELLNNLCTAVSENPRKAVALYMHGANVSEKIAEDMLKKDLEKIMKNSNELAALKREIYQKQEKMNRFEKVAAESIGQLVTWHMLADPILKRLKGGQ